MIRPAIATDPVTTPVGTDSRWRTSRWLSGPTHDSKPPLDRRRTFRSRGTPPYSTPSGSSSSRFAMYARNASSTASSIGGGS